MGAFVLVQTMGEENIIKARNLLGLGKFLSVIQIADHLLDVFHKTYPGIRANFYKGLVSDILTSGMLKHKLVGESALTRRCFGDPTKSKSHLNAYIAHLPQSLNAHTLNKAWLKVFYELSIHPQHSSNIKVMAQIHDSIFFQFRIGHEYLCDKVKELMEIELTIEGYDGKVRSFTVPADAGNTGEYWSELK